MSALSNSGSLAAIVITRNESGNIARCLESLKFCDEIVVVDSESDDDTRDIALRYTSKVFVRPWPGYAAQKNAASELTSCEWVLSVDADEVVPTELQAEIKEKLNGAAGSGVVAFSVPRRTIHLGRWIKHGGWYPNRLVRLFRKSCGSWEGSELHESWQPKGPVGILTQDLWHYSFVDLFDQVARNNRYSSLGAQKLRREGARFSILKLLGKTLSKFLETYVLKKGFLDGYPGFFISVSAAYSVFMKWAKLWELEKSEKKIGTRP